MIHVMRTSSFTLTEIKCFSKIKMHEKIKKSVQQEIQFVFTTFVCWLEPVLSCNQDFLCQSAVVGMEASEVLEVSGRVGGEVSIHCSGSWNRDSGAKHNSMYFCKGVCSSESILIQSERRRSAVVSQGRYSINNGREDGVFNVAIKKLEKADTGRYRCGVEKTLNVLYREINLIVVEGRLSFLQVSSMDAGDPF